MSSNSVFLEVDSSISEEQLKLVKDDDANDWKNFFSKNGDGYPTKLVKPYPGFCVKSKKASGEKFFVNLCYTDAIPGPPVDFTSLDPEKILDNEVPEFRVPMSIGQVRSEVDTKGENCEVCDIAINTKFFKKIQSNSQWKNFVLTIIFEAIMDKYEIDCIEQMKIILLNKKHMGTLQSHNIQDREMAKKMGVPDLPSIKPNTQPKIEMLSSSKFQARRPEYRIYKEKCYLFAEFKFPDVISADELVLDVGEDRIIIESEGRNYMLDIFVPVILRPDAASAFFDVATKVLTLTMPLVGG